MTDFDLQSATAPASDPLAWVSSLDPKSAELLLWRLMQMRNGPAQAVPGVPAFVIGTEMGRPILPALAAPVWPSNIASFHSAHMPWAQEVAPTSDLLPWDALIGYRRDVASVARLSNRIEFARCHFQAAFSASDADLVVTTGKGRKRHTLVIQAKTAKATRAKSTWTRLYAEETFARYAELKKILFVEWTPSIEAEPLVEAAFRCLSDLTPAHSQLLEYYEQDRPRAFSKLADLLDFHVDQLRSTTELAEELAALEDKVETDDDAARLKAVQADLLARAGGAVAVTAAAKTLGMTRQNLHKRIKAGSALGVLLGKEIVVPAFQFVEAGDGLALVDHLRDILLAFVEAEAGNWSALQFLVEHDPNLGVPPIEALREGKVAETLAAARAYLALDDG